mmetsp:Transcript_111980/g.210017  ORF Transcript_111980/g.210017 Transcript_111980/m.210017 type:complete len:285 (-) Transcript_111980:20-874(-)
MQTEIDGYLQETYDKIGDAVVVVKDATGKALAEVRRGEDYVLQVELDARNCISWSSGSSAREQYTTALHPETKFVRVIRATEGKLTTWRCYRCRPPADIPLRSPQGQTLEKNYGTSGMFRMIAQNQNCDECGKEIRKGGLRWVSQSGDYNLCCSCAEVKCQPVLPARSPAPLARALPGGVVHQAAVGRDVLAAALQDPPGTKAVKPRGAAFAPKPRAGVPIEQERADASRRLKRLILHGDIQGTERMLEQARRWQVPADELRAVEDQLTKMKAQGEFVLLKPKG